MNEGDKFKIHGFLGRKLGCPKFLDDGGCARGQRVELRHLCLALCGKFGLETAAMPALPCKGYVSGRMKVAGVELAHLRVAPPENRRLGYDDAPWLSRLAPYIRERISQYTG